MLTVTLSLSCYQLNKTMPLMALAPMTLDNVATSMMSSLSLWPEFFINTGFPHGMPSGLFAKHCQYQDRRTPSHDRERGLHSKMRFGNVNMPDRKETNQIIFLGRDGLPRMKE